MIETKKKSLILLIKGISGTTRKEKTSDLALMDN